MSQSFMCRNLQKTILIRYAEFKERVICILHMLKIHTSLWKLSKTNVYELHLKKILAFEIGKPCIKIARSEVLFEQYRMDIKRDKCEIEVRNDYAIKRNQIFFDFMQRTFNCMYGLYLHENLL